MIRKLSDLKAKQLTAKEQIKVVSGTMDAEFCEILYGPCPDDSGYVMMNGDCYCINPGGGGGSGGPDCPPVACTGGQYCFPSDQCASWLQLGVHLSS